MGTLSSILKLNGVFVTAPKPEGMKVTLADLDSEQGTGRSQTGVAFRDYIDDKVQIEIEWNALTQSEISAIWNAVKGGRFFPVQYLDPGSGLTTKTFYVSDRSAACYTEDPTTNTGIWTGLSFTLIEQ